MRRLIVVVAVLLLPVVLAQPRAWRDINFGDPLLVVADKIVQYEDVMDAFTPLPRRVEGGTTPEALIRYARLTTTIGGQRFTIRTEFYDGRLFRFALVSDSHDASFFDTRVRDAEWALIQLITTAHGQAVTSREVGFLDLQNGYVTWTRRWPTNDTGAAYDIGLARDTFHYYAVLNIEWTWLRELRDASLGLDPARDIREAADDF